MSCIVRRREVSLKRREPQLTSNVRRPVNGERLPGRRHVHEHFLFLVRAGSVGHRPAFVGVSAVVLSFFHQVEDLRPLPLGARKAKLARLLARRPAGIIFNEHTDEDGATVFRHVCKLGLEGIVFQAPERALPVRAVAGLAQDQEPR
jgi:hypothetical protein